jgi:hypothetical protein
MMQVEDGIRRCLTHAHSRGRRAVRLQRADRKAGSKARNLFGTVAASGSTWHRSHARLHSLQHSKGAVFRTRYVTSRPLNTGAVRVGLRTLVGGGSCAPRLTFNHSAT